MKKILLLFGVIAAFAIISCSNEQLIDTQENLNLKSSSKDICGDAKVVDLIAGQHINVGTVTISNDESNLYVKYETTGDWYLTETHVYVGPDEDIPLNNQGNPRFGHFPYKENHNNVQSYTYIIDLSDLDECFVVVTHAVVDKIVNGEIIQGDETAFGCGDKEFPGSRWGCYTDYCKQECEKDPDYDVHGFKVNHSEHSFCFADDGFTDWGWTNNLGTFEKRYEFNSFRVHLFTDGGSCDSSDAIEVGYARVVVYTDMVNGLEELLVNIRYVITNPDYVLDEVNLYLGIDKYPKDINGNDTVDPSTYDYHEDLEGVTSYSFTGLPWEGELGQDVYMIPHAKVSLATD